MVEEDKIREYLSKLDIHLSMGSDGMHPQVLRELADVIAKPLSIIFAQLCQLGEVSRDQRKANVTPVFSKGKKEDMRNYRPVSLTSVPGNVMKQLSLETISRHMKEKKIIKSSQHGFTKEKSCLTNLISFDKEMTCLMDEWGAVDIVFLDFINAFYNVPNKMLIGKLLKYVLDQ